MINFKEIKNFFKNQNNELTIQDILNMKTCKDINHNIIKDIKDINKIIKINISNKKLTTIPKCIKHFVNLKELYLYNNQISKIENIEELNNLEKLSLSDNLITKIENLNNNINLKRLLLHNNKITKIRNLDNLNNLEKLDLSGNEITKIENLDNFINLNDLSLIKNQIKYSKYNFINQENKDYKSIKDFDLLYTEQINDNKKLLENSYINYVNKINELLEKRKKLHQKIKNNNLRTFRKKYNNNENGIILIKNKEENLNFGF